VWGDVSSFSYLIACVCVYVKKRDVYVLSFLVKFKQ